MHKLLNNSLICSILYGIIFFLINLILSKINIAFMNWVYYFSNALIILGSIIGTFQLIFKIKNKIKRNIILVISTITICMVLYVVSSIFAFAYSPEYIIIKDSQKMVANVQYFHHTYIDYYKYINILMKGKETLESEYYSNGAVDPFKTDNKYILMLK